MARKRKHEEPLKPDVADDVDAQVNRRKKSAASRIGRACDRCQHRKLACDPAPEGCPPCQRVNAWCTVTDPLTGTPTYRGEFEYLERRVAKQQQDIKELLARLRSLGDNVKACDDEDPEGKRYQAWVQAKSVSETKPWERDERQTSNVRHNGPPLAPLNNGLPSAAVYGASPNNDALAHGALGLPDVRTGLAHDSYVGVTTTLGRSASCKLNMFGWEIDLSRFTDRDADDLEYPLDHISNVYNKSYRSGIASVYGINPRLAQPELPSRHAAFEYAHGYLHVINSWVPVLHRPTFLKLLTKIYDDPTFQPSTADKAMVHMVFAIMLHQSALRNFEDARKQEIHKTSDIHYHYALGLYAHLLAGNSLQSVQALALICVHVRNFSKPEIGWTTASDVLSKIVALGYHKDPQQKGQVEPKAHAYEYEMQKRVFWTVLTLQVVSSGKLGRPMPLKLEDIDVQLPLPVAEEAIGEVGSDPSVHTPCSILQSIETFKLMPTYMDVYSTIYSARRTSKEYPQFISNSERRIKEWFDQWPVEFRDLSAANDLTIIANAYLHFWMLELRLVLHHPSLSMNTSAHFNDSNLRTCLSICREMLRYVKEMQRLKGLETTWNACAVFMLAIQTTLYGHGQLKDELTVEKLSLLRTDMNNWLSIMGDVGGLLGSGRRLQEVVREQVDSGMSQLERHFKIKSASPMPKNDTPDAQGRVFAHEQAVQSPRNSVHEQEDNAVNGSQIDGYARLNKYQQSAENLQNPQAYPPTGTYTYPPPPMTLYSASASVPPAFAQSHYPASVANQALSSSYHHQQAYQTSTNELYGHSGYAGADSFSAENISWLQYAQKIPLGGALHDYQPASALLQLGGRMEHGVGLISGAHEGFDTSGMSGGAGHMWPLGLFDPRQRA